MSHAESFCIDTGSGPRPVNGLCKGDGGWVGGWVGGQRGRGWGGGGGREHVPKARSSVHQATSGET